MINAGSIEAEVSSIGAIEGEVSSVNCIEGELNNTSVIASVVLQEKSVTPSTTSQSVTADKGYDGLGKVVVNAVTSAIDSDIKATNIRKGIDILGITGTLEECVAPKLQEKTITSSTSKQEVTPDSSYDGLSKVTVNAISTATQATPTISVNSSGLITASSTQSAGYVSAGTKSSTKQLTTKGATTYTPTTSNQTIASGTYLTGTQTIKGDANLIASNIRSGKSIFGVSGTLVEGITPTGTLDITANGTHNVTNYANVNVNVASSGGGSGLLSGGTLRWTYLASNQTTMTNFQGKLEAGKNYKICFTYNAQDLLSFNFTPVILDNGYDYIGYQGVIEELGEIIVRDISTYYGNNPSMSDYTEERIYFAVLGGDLTQSFNIMGTYIEEL
jgi:hypothetical protein